MKTFLIGIAMALTLGSVAWAGGHSNPLAKVSEACAEDKAKFCSQVTPGNPERMLACAYAHEDKLSGQCSYALYQAASAMEQAAAALNYLAESCQGDVQNLCGDVKMAQLPNGNN